MAKDNPIHFFSHKAVIEAMIKRQGLHKGRWMLVAELGLRGSYVQARTEAEKDKTQLVPAGIITILRLALRQTDEINELSVDAAEVNPLPKAARQNTKRRTKKGAKPE